MTYIMLEHMQIILHVWYNLSTTGVYASFVIANIV